MREVYGDPDDFHDAWDAPFAVLALQGPTTLFVHPLVEKVYLVYYQCSELLLCLLDILVQVLDLKWTRFARTYFLVMEFW